MAVHIQDNEGEPLRYIVEGAIMMCDKGIAPSMLKTKNDHVTYRGKYLCTNADDNATENNFNFGLCSVTQKPCKGCIKLLKWVDFKKDFWIFENNVLTHKSYINCALGGKITFIQTGQ